MAEASVIAGASSTTLDEQPAASPVGAVVRDIARGGIAGIIVGLLVAGLGGRLVMRLAAILHENASGRVTENGEVIGHISLNGTLALMVFGGLGMGLLAGTIWVIVGPWIPGRGLARALLTAAAAIALGTPSLVQRLNPDFVILGHDPLVVALLVGLVGLVGLSIALVDGALDGRRWSDQATGSRAAYGRGQDSAPESPLRQPDVRGRRSGAGRRLGAARSMTLESRGAPWPTTTSSDGSTRSPTRRSTSGSMPATATG